VHVYELGLGGQVADDPDLKVVTFSADDGNQEPLVF
jgi:hypothetical protein